MFLLITLNAPAGTDFIRGPVTVTPGERFADGPGRFDLPPQVACSTPISTPDPLHANAPRRSARPGRSALFSKDAPRGAGRDDGARPATKGHRSRGDFQQVTRCIR